MLKTVEASFAQKDYQGALKILELNQGKISSGLWHYNVGTVHAKLGNFPMSRFHLLSAVEEGFDSPALASNREFVETKLEIEKLEKPINASDHLIQIGLVASSGLLTSLSLLLVVVGILALWKKKVMVFAGLITGTLVVLGLNFWINSWSQKIVMMPQPIFSGPSVIFSTTAEVPAGVKLVTEKKGSWLKIIFPSRFEGWIKDTGLKELP